jgi:Ran GTPase-activating protein (RanGAP) involved in mRNA processing and transport
MFDAMGRAVVGGITLTRLTTPTEVNEVQAAFLEPVEKALLSALEQWQPTAAEPPEIRIVLVEANATGELVEVDEEDDVDEADEEGAGEELTSGTPSESEETPSAEEAEISLRNEVARNLAQVHNQLGKLLAAWNAASDGDVEPT